MVTCVSCRVPFDMRGIVDVHTPKMTKKTEKTKKIDSNVQYVLAALLVLTSGPLVIILTVVGVYCALFAASYIATTSIRIMAVRSG